MLTFHLWKDALVRKDGGFLHARDWYYTEYGNYCNKIRRKTK